MPQRGIDRVHQVQAGINQRAVKIEDHQLDGVRIEWAIEFDHASSVRINDESVWCAVLGIGVSSVETWLETIGMIPG